MLDALSEAHPEAAFIAIDMKVRKFGNLNAGIGFSIFGESTKTVLGSATGAYQTPEALLHNQTSVVAMPVFFKFDDVIGSVAHVLSRHGSIALSLTVGGHRQVARVRGREGAAKTLIMTSHHGSRVANDPRSNHNPDDYYLSAFAHLDHPLPGSPQGALE